MHDTAEHYAARVVNSLVSQEIPMKVNRHPTHCVCRPIIQ